MAEVKADRNAMTLTEQWIAVYEDEQRHGSDHRRVLSTLHDIRGALADPAGATHNSRINTENLAHLLCCLDSAVDCMNECGRDADCQFVAAHRAQLARGREWYGDPIETVICNDGSTIHNTHVQAVGALGDERKTDAR